MSKIYGLHTLELRPGVSPDEFEQFVADNLTHWPEVEGWQFSLLKGDRGDRAGHYLSLIELDDAEARDRLSPAGGLADTEEGRELLAVIGPLLQEWGTYLLHVPGFDAPYTDYVAVLS